MLAKLTAMLVCSLVAATPAPAADLTTSPDKLVAEGRARYDAADYGAALIKFEEAIKQGAQGGELFYQAGYCYRAVREDQETSRTYMQKAAPLLEEKIKSPSGADLRSYYYLAAIYLNEVPNADRLQSLSTEATAALEAGGLGKPKSGEEFFQAGRLYGFIQKRDIAAGYYVKAIDLLEKAPGGAKGQIYHHCLQAAGDMALETKDWNRAADLFGRLVASDPDRDEMKMPMALALFRAGREEEAARVWEQTRDPRIAEQKAYFSRITRRFVELGRPSPAAPEKDEDLRAAIIAAAKKYAEVRKVDDEAATAAQEQWLDQRRKEKEAGRPVRKAGAKRPAPPPVAEDDYSSIPPEKMTPEQRLRSMGIKDFDLEPPPPPPSAVRLIAEKEFFGLLAELVRRGNLVRDWAVTNGLAPVIFK